jgi:hypothetical protein
VSDYEVKPVSLKQGMPKAQKNSLFGSELAMIENPSRFLVAIVTFSIDEIVEKRIAGERYPVISIEQIETLGTEEAKSAALALRDEAYRIRTGINQLKFDGIGDEPEETPQTPENVADLGKGKKGQF